MVRVVIRDELEAKIEQDSCNQIALQLGVRNLKFNSSSDTSWPDRIYLLPGGRPGFIEYKKPGEVPEPKQAYTHEVMRKLGYRVEVSCSIDEALAIIRRWLREDLEAKEK